MGSQNDYITLLKDYLYTKGYLITVYDSQHNEGCYNFVVLDNTSIEGSEFRSFFVPTSRLERTLEAVKYTIKSLLKWKVV